MNYNEVISAKRQDYLNKLYSRVSDLYIEVKEFAEDFDIPYHTALELYKITLLSDANYHLDYIGSEI